MHTDELTLHAIAWPGIASAIFAPAGFILACCKWASESKADEARRNLADDKDKQRREWASKEFKNFTDDLNQARAELQNVTDRLERAERTITRQQKLIEELLRDRSDHGIRMTLYSTALSLAEDRIKGLMENGGDQDKAIIDLENTVKELKNQIDALRRRLECPLAEHQVAWDRHRPRGLEFQFGYDKVPLLEGHSEGVNQDGIRLRAMYAGIPIVLN